MIGVILCLIVMGRRTLMLGCIVGAIWMPEYQKQWALTLLAILIGEAFYQSGRAQAIRANEPVTDQSQTLYSSREDQ
jgi:hypothetical protein